MLVGLAGEAVLVRAKREGDTRSLACSTYKYKRGHGTVCELLQRCCSVSGRVSGHHVCLAGRSMRWFGLWATGSLYAGLSRLQSSGGSQSAVHLILGARKTSRNGG